MKNDSNVNKNLLRESSLRYLGYANEIGESFRPLIPLKIVISTYVVSGLYVFADSLFIGLKSYNNEFSLNKKYSFVVSFSKCLIWQILATELIPGFLVYKIVKIAISSKKYLRIKNDSLSRWFPTFIGLGFIPFFPYSVDPFVDYSLNLIGISLDSSNL